MLIKCLGERLKFFSVLRVGVFRALIIDKAADIFRSPKAAGVVIHYFISVQVFIPNLIKFTDTVTHVTLAASKPTGVHNGVNTFTLEHTFKPLGSVFIGKLFGKDSFHVAFCDGVRAVVPVRIAENNVVSFGY